MAMRRLYKPSLWIPQHFSVQESELAPRALAVLRELEQEKAPVEKSKDQDRGKGR
jgi:hypothetical protein